MSENPKFSHETVEKKVSWLGVWIVAVIAIGGLVEIVPLYVSNEVTTAAPGVKPYAALELEGRDIYIREGCYNCHSQMVRPFLDETVRYGINGQPAEYSRPGEFVYEIKLPVALYTAQANVQEASDSSKSGLATEVLLSRLGEQLGPQLLPAGRVTAAAGSREARGLSGDQPCNVIVACSRQVGKSVGARWAVMAKVSKTSNLIWLFTGQLIRVETGEIVLDDSTELKGDPDQMVRVGTRIFADRVARVVRSGGVVTNFPNAGS